MRWMRLTSRADHSNADIWKPMPSRASSSADLLGRPAESGPVIVPLLSNMSWLTFSCSVMRASSATSRASAPAGASATQGAVSASVSTRQSVATNRWRRIAANMNGSAAAERAQGAQARCAASRIRRD